MKKAIYILMVCCLPAFTACSYKSFEPTQSSNPWKDDYRSVSGMKDYMKWGTYNVHDPSCKLFGDTFYMYSTDAIFGENKKEIQEKKLPFGYIQVRKSKDLVHWEFAGWAFREIPQ